MEVAMNGSSRSCAGAEPSAADHEAQNALESSDADAAAETAHQVGPT
jgi:hypothetical protein